METVELDGKGVVGRLGIVRVFLKQGDLRETNKTKSHPRHVDTRPSVWTRGFFGFLFGFCVWTPVVQALWN